jgi:hypothetical protein
MEDDDRLGRCAGFEVISAERRRVGVVAWLRYSSRLDRPDALAVRTGLRQHRRLILIGIEDVQEVDLHTRCVILRPAVPANGSAGPAGRASATHGG